MIHLILAIGILSSSLLLGAENCTEQNREAVCRDQVVIERVAWACALIQEKGEAATEIVRKMRYDCCGEPDYVWINDLFPRMIVHPMKPTMEGQDLRDNRDANGKKIMVKFIRATKLKPDGSWVDYVWPQYGALEATPKKSWVRRCKVGQTARVWIVGSGTWK